MKTSTLSKLARRTGAAADFLADASGIGAEMRISFGSASEENIREGIKRLGGALRKTAAMI